MAGLRAGQPVDPRVEPEDDREREPGDDRKVATEGDAPPSSWPASSRPSKWVLGSAPEDDKKEGLEDDREEAPEDGEGGPGRIEASGPRPPLPAGHDGSGEHQASRRTSVRPRTRRSILVRRKQSSASSGRQTIGSFSLKLVFKRIGTPVFRSKAAIRSK